MHNHTDDPNRVRVIDPNEDPAPLPEIVIRRFTAHGCVITGVIIDPADAQQLLYATVTRPDGTLAGTYYAADRVRGEHWRIVTADGAHYHAPSEPHAVAVLTTITTD